MCHGLRACANIRRFRLGVIAVCLGAACFAHDAAAQTRAFGQGAPPVTPPRSSLRIGDVKRSGTAAAPSVTTPNGATPANSATNPYATSGDSSSSGSQGSQLQIRRPVEPQPRLQPQPELRPQQNLAPRTQSPIDAESNAPQLQLQPSVRNPPSTDAPADRAPAYTASTAPLAPRAPLPPRASMTLPSAAGPTDSGGIGINSDGALPMDFAPAVSSQSPPQLAAPAVLGPTAPNEPELPQFVPLVEPTIVAVPSPGRATVNTSAPKEIPPSTAPATVPPMTMPLTTVPNVSEFQPPLSNSPPPAIVPPTTVPNVSAFLPPPSTAPVDFAPTRTITRSKPQPVDDLLSPAPLPDPAEPGALPKLEPVDFNGILLGESTVDEVLKAWGEPVRRSGTGNDLRLNYKIEPFDSIDVTFFDRKAEAIVIELGDKFPTADIIKELSLNQADSVPVEDPTGKPLGIVFPERGVSLRFETAADGQPLVATIGLDRISARPFVLRAERLTEESYTAALTDLAIASNLDPKNSRAQWLRAKLLLKVGRPRAAMEAIESALKIDPKAADYLLTRAELLADEGLFDAALADNDTVLEGTKALPLYQARAWCQRGDFLANGLKPDYSAAIDAHTRAVRLVEPLAADKNRSLRRGAKRMLVEAHLAIAQDVAWGEWQSKETVVERWLKKAESLAAEGFESGDLPLDALLEVYVRAASACVGTQGKGETLAWAERLKAATDEALADCNDPLRRKKIQFEAGLGLYDALQALHARGDIENALKYGTEAVELIQQGRVGRDETPIDAYRFGRLYFRIGSLYAVKRNDHATAVEWFARAAPLLERPLAESAAADRGRQGETLVSMGISYWALGNRERALQLTNVGTNYMQQAVRDGVLAAPAMGVAYTNLATMHKQLGDETTSRKFVELAARVEPAAPGVLRR